MSKHIYRYLQYVSTLDAYRSKGGGYYHLRRDDGKKVKVSQRRLNQLRDEGRLLERDDPRPLCT